MAKAGTPRNCWEVVRCGREPGGAHAAAEGVCPAAVEVRLDGLNRGHNGGRSCWGVPGTRCREAATRASDGFTRCLDCAFFQRVEREEGRGFVVMKEILVRLKRSTSNR